MLDDRLRHPIILKPAQPLVMGILNCTPDSFSDGGKFVDLDAAVQQALDMVAQGADIIDVGGESTRPGADVVTLEQELQRVIPVIQEIRKVSDVAISIDSSKPQVFEQAVAVGADIINDVRALQLPGALQAAASLDVPVCLMHMQGTPQTMQNNPDYHAVVDDVMAFFAERIEACENAGIAKDKIWLDPGFGFGKTLTHNFQLLANLSPMLSFNMPLLIGLSRKTMIGEVTGKTASQRMAGSVAGAMIAAQQGAQIIRVHDVDETVDVLKILNRVEQESSRE